MKRPLFVAATLAALAVFAAAQAAAPRIAFEVASVKPAPPDNGDQVSIGLQIDGAQVHINDFSLKDLICMAYRIKPYQVTAPAWAASRRFDIAAKLPSGGTREQVPEMLQALLADSFQLASHTDSQTQPVYLLTLARNHPALKESAPLPAADADAPAPATTVNGTGSHNGVSLNLSNGAAFSLGDNQIQATHITLSAFADTLARFMSRPVVDETGTTAAYDFKVALTADDYRALLIESAVNAGVDLPPQALQSIQGATLDSLLSGLNANGLQLELKSAPMPMRIVDHVNETPAAN